ncbi:MAG: histidine phosphatase family protein [Planctomycetota bacterium]
MTRPIQAGLLIVTLAVLGVVPALAQDATDPDAGLTDPLDGAALVSALRRGGLVVYFRHAQTEKDYADQINADPNDGSTQRVLSEEGWHQAKAIGASWRRLGLPVGEVISSQYFRAWQTADLAFGRYTKNAALNFEPAEEYTDEQFDAMRARTQPMLSAPVYVGVNRVIVGHDDPFEASTGIYPEPQGVAYVIRPLGKDGGPGEGFELLARLEAGDWAELPSP